MQEDDIIEARDNAEERTISKRGMMQKEGIREGRDDVQRRTL